MKKIIVLVFLIFAANMLFGQQASYSEFKAGIYNPKDAKTGWMFTYGTGKTIDEAFSWLVEFNLYNKSYSKNTKIAEESLDGGLVESEMAKELDLSTYLMPLMFKITFDKKLAPGSPLMIRGSAGLGYQFLWNREENFIEDKKDTRFYHGFAYQVSAGAGIEMSSSAILFAEAFYHGGKVKRNKSDKAGLPTWSEVDMSGIGFRVGINFVNFGLF